MTRKHINIFLKVCECNNNITKSAKLLFMTQPAVTVAIQEIEKYYGILLFDRLGKRLYLTEAGKEFRDYALRIAGLFDDMEKRFHNWDNAGILRIGASITIGSQFMPSYVETFSNLTPNVDIRVIIAPTNVLKKKIISNEIDLALVESNIQDTNIVVEEYMDDSMAVITPARKPFYPDQTMSIEDFKKQRFLLREIGSGTRDSFEQIIKKYDFCIEPVWEGMSTAALVNAVKKGLGISILPKRMITRDLENGNIYSIQIENLNFSRKFYITYHKDKRINRMLNNFIELVRNYELNYPLPSSTQFNYNEIENDPASPYSFYHEANKQGR